MKRYAVVLVAASLASLLTACGGGGGAPSVHSAAGNPAAPAQAGTLSLTIAAASGSASTARSPKFVSPNASSASVSINSGAAQSFDVSATSALCQTVSSVRTCSIPLTAPFGQDSIAVALFGSGTPAALLGSGSNSVSVVAGTNFATTVGIMPSAVGIGTFSFSPSPSFQYTVASNLTATVTFTDASGAAITGSGAVPNFLVPVTLSSSDSNVTFTPSSLMTPGQTFQVAYNGSAAVSSRVTITVKSGTTVIASAPVIVPGLVVQRVNLGAIGTINPQEMAIGSDGNVFVAEYATNSIAKINGVTGAVMGTFPTGFSGGSHPVGIANGGDGNLYYTEATSCQMGRMNTSGAAPSAPQVTDVNGSSCALRQVAADNSGNIWYMDSGNNTVGVMVLGSWPGGFTNCGSTGLSNNAFIIQNNGIIRGADNAMWFTENFNKKIGRVASPAACGLSQYTEYPVANANAGDIFGIALGSDNNLWFNVLSGDFYAKISTAGVVNEYPGLIPSTSFANPVVITVASDGNMWIPQGGGAVSFNPANPTQLLGVQFFSDVGQTDNHFAMEGPDGDVWFSGLGSNPGSGFTPTQDEVARFAPR